jgi:hypothetical protein
MTTQKIEPIINDSSLLDATTPPKRSRGRPAKYTKEEREDKYKEASKVWKQEHKEYYKETQKQYYEQHSDVLCQNKKDNYERSVYALRLLNDVYNQSELISHFPDDLREKIENLVQRKRIILS